jgi:hypothetical protein
MIRKFIMSIAVMLLLTGHSHVLNAQCKAPCSSTTQYDLNEVVICHQGVCGKDGTFHFSRSASLFSALRDLMTSQLHRS